MLNKNQKTCHYYSFFFLPSPTHLVIIMIIIIVCKDWKIHVIL